MTVVEALVAAADVVAALGFAVALTATALIARRRRLDGTSLFLLGALASMGLFYGVSNTLEHTGVTSALDVYEDYAEILFVPFFLYFAYSIRTASELRRRRGAEAALSRANRGLTVVTQCLQALARATDERDLAMRICNILIEVGGFAYARIELSPGAHRGEGAWAASAGRGGHGCSEVCNEHGASATYELHSGGKALGLLRICTDEAELDASEEALLGQLADDSAYGVRALREQDARRRAEAALQESETRYRLLVELSPDAIFVVVDDRLAFANAASLRLLGAGSAQEVMGRRVEDFMRLEEGPGTQVHLTEWLPLDEGALASGGGPAQAATRNGRILSISGDSTSGGGTDVEISAAPFSFGGRQAVLVVARDITERKQVEQLKDDFLSMVSHELRTPINAILGYASILAGIGGEDDAARKKALQRIPERAAYMARLVEDLLDVTRIQSGDLELEFAPTDLGQLLMTCAEGLPRDAKIEVQLDVPAGLPPISCDAKWLSLAVSNLLSNALKFSPEGGLVHASVAVRPDAAVITVRDEGVGIAEADLGRIFDRFTQADMGTTRPFGGFGLGLYIVKRVAEAHGGTVAVTSELGKGSTFVLTVPR